MTLFTTDHSSLLVRIHPENVPGTIAFMKEKWEEIAPALEFRFSFVDENIDRQYRKEERWNQMIQYATGFAIFIAVLGAFGLAALATTRRTKEIGIRKVWAHLRRKSYPCSRGNLSSTSPYQASSHSPSPITRPINGYKPSPTALNWVLVYSYSAALFCSSSYSQPSPPRPSKPHAQTRRML